MGPLLALMSSQGFPASVRRQPTPAQARTREDGLHPRWGWLRRGSDHRPYYRRRAPANRRPRTLPAASAGLLSPADLGLPISDLLAVFKATPELAVVVSAAFAVVSVAVNLYGGVITEQKRAELQLELERDKLFQKQLQEVQSMIARYRGPLLEAAIDLEQRLWHLLTDTRPEQRAPEAPGGCDMRYLLFTLAQFLAYVEVVRRDGPRERSFLQMGSFEGSNALSTLVEGIRFVLCASHEHLQEWYADSPQQRTHPGARTRRTREEVVRQLQQRTQHAQQAAAAAQQNGGPAGHGGSAALMHVPRGEQRAIGTLFITTPMGADRHYTLSYNTYFQQLDEDPHFRFWFERLEREVRLLATGSPWMGEGPFPIGPWTRVLLLQQLLVELVDLLDPDCVRQPLARRVRLAPVAWAKLPGLTAYQQRLQELAGAAEFGLTTASLEGMKDLMRNGSPREGQQEGQQPASSSDWLRAVWEGKAKEEGRPSTTTTSSSSRGPWP